MLRIDPTGSPGEAGAATPASRADAIVEAIHEAVVEHRITPGTRLSEDQIGAAFGVSRTIVRAALQRLAHDHIVTLAKNRGASVAAPSVENARHLFEARRELEDIIVRRAAARMTPADAARLEELIEESRLALDAAERGRAIRLSGEFHRQIAAVAGQPVLAAFLAELISRSSLVIALYGASRHADCGIEAHRELLRALAAGEAAAAARLMHEHLAHIEADLDLADRAQPPIPLRQALRPQG